MKGGLVRESCRVARPPVVEAQHVMAEARELAFSPLVGEAKMRDDAFVKIFRETKRDAETQKRMTALEEHWAKDARVNYERAAELAKQAAALAR